MTADSLTAADRDRLAELRAAGSLSELEALTDAEDEHGAYLAAKREWYDLRGRELPDVSTRRGLPGTTVEMDGDGTRVHVHGVTHADTPQERQRLRRHVGTYLEDGAAVYCEQGIRPMYFENTPEVCAMDDYRWALRECEKLDDGSHVADLVGPDFEGLGEQIDTLSTRFREAAFSLVDAGSTVYGDSFESVLGDVASALFTSHEQLATGRDFEAFSRSRAAATDPGLLADLQRYYARRFLPQPVEREWLRRHDPELELVTHARNERMADYALYHTTADDTHLIVGAAHQPGVAYYLARHRDGHRDLEGFELA